MKISYEWLKWYIPEIPPADKLSDIFTFHVCEVDSLEKLENGDYIFDLKVLPDRAHDLLSHQGVAREIASLLNLKFVDPTSNYKIPESLGHRSVTGEAKPTNLEIKLETELCRRYTGRIVRNVTVGKSPDWVVKHLESIGQRSINNIVDAANIVMYDCGQPIHAFDLDKVNGALIVRPAKDGEEITTLDNKQVKLSAKDLVIADEKNVLAVAGIKGGKVAEVDENTKNIIIEIANFDPVSVRKTRRAINIFTDAAKRFENDLSPELCDFAMREMCGLLVEYGCTEFEDVVDVYPKKPESRKLKFRLSKMSSMLGYDLKPEMAQDVLTRYNFNYTAEGDWYEIEVPNMRLDLVIEEDMAEEFGRVLGYDKVVPELPKTDFNPHQNETYQKIQWARNDLLSRGYSEVITYAFCNKGDVEVLASASDKKFLRKNLSDGLKESFRLNKLNTPLLGFKEVKLFEIGTIFNKDKEVINIAFANNGEISELSLEDYCYTVPWQDYKPISKQTASDQFQMWSLYPFIVRDIALWVPEGVSSDEAASVISDNINELVVKGPELFDTFTKDGRTSYAFRLVFQSFDRTLTDEEVGSVMDKINNSLKANSNWELR